MLDFQNFKIMAFKSLDPDPELDPNQHWKTNADPQHWFPESQKDLPLYRPFLFLSKKRFFGEDHRLIVMNPTLMHFRWSSTEQRTRVIITASTEASGIPAAAKFSP